MSSPDDFKVKDMSLKDWGRKEIALAALAALVENGFDES